MKNYGEELAYWYFRLNGFIPMSDFVLHRVEREGDEAIPSSDCDLLAIRFPHVFEDVGGQPDDWDGEFLTELGFTGSEVLAAFVQVKTGRCQDREIRTYFDTHLDKMVLRMGRWTAPKARQIAVQLRTVPALRKFNYVLSKVAVVHRTPRRREGAILWKEFELERIVQFLHRRMLKYANAKHGDRMYFPSPLIQFVIAQARERSLRLHDDA